MNKNQKGFTIIELVVVILLLGILTATALPRFMDVTAQAHTAVNQGVMTGLQTSISMFRAAYVAQGEPASGTVITGAADGATETNPEGFPVDDAATITAAICANTYTALLQEGGAPTAVAHTIANTQPTAALINAATADYLAWVDTAAPDVCRYTYTEEAVAAGDTATREITYDTTTGVVTLTTVQSLLL